MDTQTPCLIGLAGQSCAGKNVAADLFAKRNYAVIDADRVTRALLVALAPELISRYAAHAEQRNLLLAKPDGTLDTRALGALLFADSDLLASHEAFILPKVEQRIEDEIRSFHAQHPGRPIVLNAPTLHKTALMQRCTFIIYIEAPYILRVIRCKKRDGLPLRAIYARFSQQKAFLAQYLMQGADIIRVKNRGTPACLEKKLERILVRKGI